MEYVKDFKELRRDSILEAGGKNASLGEMIGAGIRVPPGFAVTTKAYLDFLEKGGIRDEIFSILSQISPEDVEDLNNKSLKIRDHIRSIDIPQEIKSAIEKRYVDLCDVCGVEDLPVAVRSSATAEDLPTASFAGQQETYLWIRGVEEVASKVRDCWASLFTPRAISYRIKNRFSHEKVLISVGVQKMVNSRTAGVMFTLNPIDGDLSKVVIEGSWGLGESVVSGSVTPDKFVVDKVVLEITERTISRKHIQCVYDPLEGKVVEKDMEEDMQNMCCLQDEEIKELVKMAKRIEDHYGTPMDIEWAIDNDLEFPENIFIVQARPETVWSQKKKGPVIGKKSGFELLMEQAMKRIKLS